MRTGIVVLWILLVHSPASSRVGESASGSESAGSGSEASEATDSADASVEQSDSAADSARPSVEQSVFPESSGSATDPADPAGSNESVEESSQERFESSDSPTESRNSALADELFTQAKALMDRRDYRSACQKFEESQRLDPAVGTLLNLANCHERIGKFASAWTEYSEVVTVAYRQDRPDRVAYAKARLSEIEGRLSKLTIVLSEESDVAGLTVTIDGTKIGRPAFGIPLPVDAGRLSVEVSANGRISHKVVLTIERGPSQQEFQVPALKEVMTSLDEEEDTTLAHRKKLRTGGLIVGATGVVSLAAGSLFGVLALSKKQESLEEGCDADVCEEKGFKIRNEARDFGNLSTATFVAGGACLSAGTVLFLLGREPSKGHGEKSPQVGFGAGPDGAWLSYGGAF